MSVWLQQGESFDKKTKTFSRSLFFLSNRFYIAKNKYLFISVYIVKNIFNLTLCFFLVYFQVRFLSITLELPIKMSIYHYTDVDVSIFCLKWFLHCYIRG